MKHFSYIAAVALTLSACSQIPDAAHFNRGSPYSLLDASSEMVNIALVSPESVNEVVQWIDQDQPTQAELYCLESDPVCLQTLQTLEMFRVPVHYVAAADNNLVLFYDRVVARDCDNRYIDNPVNPYNLNHKTFGCTMAVNIVQHVGDKRQFTSPSLLDFRDGDKAIQDYNIYLLPRDTNQLSEDSSQLQSAISN